MATRSVILLPSGGRRPWRGGFSSCITVVLHDDDDDNDDDDDDDVCSSVVFLHFVNCERYCVVHVLSRF